MSAETRQPVIHFRLLQVKVSQQSSKTNPVEVMTMGNKRPVAGLADSVLGFSG